MARSPQNSNSRTQGTLVVEGGSSTFPASQESSVIQGTSSPKEPFIEQADLVHTTSTSFVREEPVIALRPNKPQVGKSDRRKPGLVPYRRAQPQGITSSGGVQLIYLPEGSLKQLSSARAARITPTKTPRQSNVGLLEVSPQPLPELVQNVGFSDKQKRDHSGQIISGGASNALPVSILTIPGQEQEAREKLRLLEAALTTPEENKPDADSRLPRVFIAPSNVPPPPGYVKIPLVPHGEPGISSVPTEDRKLPQTFLTSDKSSPPPGFIKFDLPEDVSQLSRGIPVVVPNNLPSQSPSGLTQALDILGANRQPRTSKSQRPTVQTIQREEPKLSSTPLPEKESRPPILLRGQPHFPPRPEQPPNHLQINQSFRSPPRPNQGVSKHSQPKQPFPERPQFIPVFPPPLPTLHNVQSFTLHDQSLPRPSSTSRPVSSSSAPEESFSLTEQPQRQSSQPIIQTDSPFAPKETTPQTDQLLPQSNLQPSEPQKPNLQPERPISQSSNLDPQTGQSFLQFDNLTKTSPSFPPSAKPSPQPDQLPSQRGSLQPDRPFQPGQPFPQPTRPFPKLSQPFQQPGQPFLQPSQTFPHQRQPFSQPGKSFPRFEQPFQPPEQSFPQFDKSGQSGHPLPQSGQSFGLQGQPGHPFPQLKPRPFFPQLDQPTDQNRRPAIPRDQTLQQDRHPFRQPSQPFLQPGQTFPQPNPLTPPPEQRGQSTQSSLGLDQATPQPGHPFPHSDLPLPQPSQSTLHLGQPGQKSHSSLQHGETTSRPGQQFPQPGKAFSQQSGLLFSQQSGQLFPQQPGQSVPRQPEQAFPRLPEKPFSQPRQPFPQSGQPSSQLGQPFPQSGQLFPQPGHIFPQPNQALSRQPGKPFPHSNQPFPQDGQRFSQLDQPSLPSGQPFPQSDQLLSQPNLPDPLSKSILPQPSQSFPQRGQASPPPGQTFSQHDQSFPQSDTPLSQSVPQFETHSRQPLITSPAPLVTTPLNLKSASKSEVRSSTLQVTEKPIFKSKSAEKKVSTFQTTPRPILTSPITPNPSSTFHPRTPPRFTTHFAQRSNTTFQTTPNPNFVSHFSPTQSSTFQGTPRPSIVSQSSPSVISTFQPPLIPNFIPQPVRSPSSKLHSPSRSSITSSTTPRITPTSRTNFPSLSVQRPRFSTNSFPSQDEIISSDTPLIPQTSPVTTPSPAFSTVTNPLDTQSESPAISIPGAVSSSLPTFASPSSPRPLDITDRIQAVSAEESAEPPSLSKKPFTSSTLRPKPVSLSGFPSLLPTVSQKTRPVSLTPRPLSLPTFAPFSSTRNPPTRQIEGDGKPKHFRRPSTPSFRDPQESSVSQPQAPRRPNFAPFQPPSLTSTQAEQTTPFKLEDTNEGFLSTVASAQLTTTTTTTPRVTTFKPRFDFNIANRRRHHSRKQRPNNPPNKEDEGTAKKEVDTALKKDGGEKKTETVTLFPPFSVARTLNPLRSRKEGGNDETSDGVTVPPAGVFGRRLNPRTRPPFSSSRSKDSDIKSDLVEEETSTTGAAKGLHSQNRGRARSPLGLRGRELPEWLKARRRNRGRGRLRGTEAPKETKNEQIEDSPLDVLENNGFNAAESIVVEYSSPLENKVTQPLNPHDALKQLEEDAANVPVEKTVEPLETTEETLVDHVTEAAADVPETYSSTRIEYPQEQRGGFIEQPALHPRFREITQHQAEETKHPDVEAEPEPEPEPEGKPEPEPKAEILDEGATTEPESVPQYQPQYVYEDDLHDKTKTPLPHYRLSGLSSSPLTFSDPLRLAPISSPVSQSFPRHFSNEPSIITFSNPSVENFDSESLWSQTQKYQSEALTSVDIANSSDSDRSERVIEAVANNHSTDMGVKDALGHESDITYYHVTTEFPEISSLFPNDHFTTFSPGEAQDYYSYEYDDLYDDPAEQSGDQKFGGSSAKVVFAVPVTEYDPEFVLTTTPATERVETFSEFSLSVSDGTILKDSQVTVDGPQGDAEAFQVTSSPEHTSNKLQETTEMTHVIDLSQITDVPEVTEEIIEVTEEASEVTEEVPQVTTEDAEDETTTEPPVTSKIASVLDDTTTAADDEFHLPVDVETSTPGTATPAITFLPFPFAATTPTSSTSTTTSRSRPVSIRPLHARLLNARKKKLSPSTNSTKKDPGALKIVAKSTVAEIQSSDPVVCFPGHPCVRAVGVGRLLRP